MSETSFIAGRICSDGDEEYIIRLDDGYFLLRTYAPDHEWGGWEKDHDYIDEKQKDEWIAYYGEQVSFDDEKFHWKAWFDFV